MRKGVKHLDSKSNNRIIETKIVWKQPELRNCLGRNVNDVLCVYYRVLRNFDVKKSIE